MKNSMSNHKIRFTKSGSVKQLSKFTLAVGTDHVRMMLRRRLNRVNAPVAERINFRRLDTG